MKPVFLAFPLTLLFASGVHAQSSPYDCQNDPVRVDIPAQTLSSALDTLSQQTKCPISRDADVAGLGGNAVKGRMKATDALIALVRGTGLEGHPVRQGLAVDRTVQQEITKRADTLERRIQEHKEAGRLPAARAVSLNRQVAQVRRQAETYARRQGFVSAAQKASFKRTFQQVDAALGS
jgi:hypothetical protein